MYIMYQNLRKLLHLDVKPIFSGSIDRVSFVNNIGVYISTNLIEVKLTFYLDLMQQHLQEFIASN